MGFQKQYPGGGSAKDASAATAYSMIMQAINTASVDGGYKIAEEQGVFPELSKLLAGVEINSATVREAFDNAADALTIASSSVLRDLINAGGYVDQLGRASSALYPYYGGYDLASLEYAQTSSGGGLGTPSTGLVLNADYSAVWWVDASTVYRRALTVPGDLQGGMGALQSADLNSLVGLSGLLDIDIKPDESRLLVSDNGTDDIYELVMSTPGNLSTLSLNAQQAVNNVPRGLCYSDDGAAVYYLHNGNSQIVRWPLSTPYDFSSRGTAVLANLPSDPTSGFWAQVRQFRTTGGEAFSYFGFSSSSKLYRYSRSAGDPTNPLAFGTLTEIDLGALNGSLTRVNGLHLSGDDLRSIYASNGTDAYKFVIPPTELQAPA